MNLKNFLRIASFVMITAIAIPVSASISVPSTPEKNTDPKVEVLMNRLHEIKEINKSELTRLEKKNLRKEVKEIKSEMKAISGGVYLSVGAIIIVILLLILLL